MNITESHEVSVIPATKRSDRNAAKLKELKNLRVAAYCRVSTGDESQQTSYTSQKAFYTGLINGKEGWKMAGVYADEGLSGTSRSKRVEFNKMIDDAMHGRIDYIVTKSISRFARNTVDTLDCVRQLREQTPPVGIYFEKENIDTLDAKGELILTILSALAQDESRSISDNIRWTFQKKFRDGKPQINLNRMLGYDKGPEGTWVINVEQAKTVRYIFEHYMYGESANAIAGKLNENGRLTVNGKQWTASTVFVVLRNEKYVGDLAMQKTITKNFLTHRSTKNNGEAPMYYVKNHHVGIVSRTTWDQVQLLLKQKSMKAKQDTDGEKKTVRRSKISPIANLVCSNCGAKYLRMNYTSYAKNYTDSRSLAFEKIDERLFKEKYIFSYTVYRCKNKLGERQGRRGRMSEAEKAEAAARCPSETLHEAAIEQSFMEKLYVIRKDYMENGEKSEIVQLFNAAYDKEYKSEKGKNFSIERIEIINAQLKKLEESYNRAIAGQAEAMRAEMLANSEELHCKIAAGAITMEDVSVDLQEGYPQNGQGAWKREKSDYIQPNSEAVVYAGLAADLKQRIEEMREEKRKLEMPQGQTALMKKNFSFFVKCLSELPDKNKAGMKLNVNGIDVNGSVFVDRFGEPKRADRGVFNSSHFKVTPEQISEAPDILEFAREMYFAFVTKGEVSGDTIVYGTNFGVPIITVGNSRKLAAFLGFRRGMEEGGAEFMTETWQINGRKVQYSRKKKKTFLENGRRLSVEKLERRKENHTEINEVKALPDKQEYSFNL